MSTGTRVLGLRSTRTCIVALPFCKLRLKAAKPRSKSYPARVLTLGDAIRKRRLDLGLFQKEAAAIIGCTTESIVNWEKGRNRPDISLTGKVVEFLGYNPFSEGATLAERLANYRKARGMRQKDFARALGIDPATLASYEQGHRPVEKYRLALTEFLNGAEGI